MFKYPKISSRFHPSLRPGKLPATNDVVIADTEFTKDLWDLRLYDSPSVRNLADPNDRDSLSISTSSQFGYIGLDFTSSQWISLGTANRFQEYTKYAICVPDSLNLNNIVSGTDSGGNNQHAFWFHSNTLQSGHNGTWSTVSDSNVSTGNLYHVAVTYDGDAIKLYKNGVLVDSATGLSGPSYSGGESAIATFRSGTYDYDGRMFLTAVWERALPQAQVEALYKREAEFLFKPKASNLYYFPAAAPGGTTPKGPFGAPFSRPMQGPF